MRKMNNCLSGIFTYGSPGLSAFESKGEKSAVEMAAAAGYKELIISDTTIAHRAINEAAAKANGAELRQGWIVMVSDSEEGIGPCLLTLFPAALPEFVERLFVEWSTKYPRVPFNPLSVLPFGGEEPAPLLTQIPLQVLRENKESLLIFNATLDGSNCAIPYKEELMELYDGFFVRCDGTYEIPLGQIRYLKRLRKRAMFLPHFHIGSFVEGQRDAKCLQELLKAKAMFPLPDVPKAHQDGISLQEFQQLYGLFTGGVEFFMNTPHIEVTGALIPGAKVSAEYQAVEIVPEQLRPTDEERRNLLEELRGLCMARLQELYEGEELQCGIEVLQEELHLLYSEKFHGFMLAKTLLMLHQVLRESRKKHCILVKYFNHVPLITYLFRLSRFNPLDNELGNHVCADIICSMNFLHLETSAETYQFIAEKLQELYPMQVAEVAEEQTAGQLIDTQQDCYEMRKAISSLTYAERESLKNAVVAFRNSTNGNHNLIIAPEKVCLPGVRVEGSDIPMVTPSFCYLASVLVMNLSFSCTETLSRFERVDEAVLQKYLPKLTKRVERKLFKDFLPHIDRVMSAGIQELSPLVRKLIRESTPASRYELAALFAKHCLDGEYYTGIQYNIQMADVILNMLAVSLSHPEEYFEAIDLHDHNLDWNPEEVLERMVYEPIINREVDEYTEALLIKHDIDTEHFLRETANSDRPLIEYAKRKRYPVLFLG